MAIFRTRYVRADGTEQERLLEADWQADVERELASRGYRLVSIEHVYTADPGTPSGLAHRKGGFWSFRRFVTPSLVSAFFIGHVIIAALVAALSLIVDVGILASARSAAGTTTALIGVLLTVIFTALYILSVRIVLELIIVIFRIYEELVGLRGDLSKR